MADAKREVLEPSATLKLAPPLHGPIPPEAQVWVYRYTHATRGWRFSIATLGEPQSQKLSLGGFRIVPEARAALPGFDTDREAIGLALGMEEKVYWSRILKVGGTLAQRNLARIVGGKCVLLPSKGSRIGEPLDRELLDFALECFHDMENCSGVNLVTGQDLGHGMLSDGLTSSLQYLNARFKGAITADTSRPTGEGNYYFLLGALRAFAVPVKASVLALIGVGNIGDHLLYRLQQHGAKLLLLEARDDKRKALQQAGYEVFAPTQKKEFLGIASDALVVNANGSSLDAAAVDQIIANPRTKIVCGCENLVMPDPHDADRLRQAHRLYGPTELCGMLGYLTAVEQYLSNSEGKPFVTEQMFEPARKMEEAAFRGAQVMIKSDFTISFEQAVQQCYLKPAQH